MTSETPFKVGEIYKTRGGEDRKILYIAPPELKSAYPILAISTGKEMKPKVYSLKGEKSRCVPTSDDLLPPAPPGQERRTVFFNMYDNCVYAHFTKESANSPVNLNGRQGEAVPVPLERQPDGGWRVVAEKTAKELAADEMYEALKTITIAADEISHGFDWKNITYSKSQEYDEYRIIMVCDQKEKFIASINLALTALAKAEGRE